MNKRLHRRFLLLLSVLVAALLGGCFGLVSGLLPQPPGGGSSTPNTSVVGVVLAPDSAADSLMTASSFSPLSFLSPVAQAFTGTVPVAGATVQALEVPSLKPIGEPVTTDSNGRYTLSGLPEGIEVIVVAVKDTGQGPLRLSTYVRNVGKNTVADADPASSLAAELLAAKFKEASDYQISEQDWLTALAAAERVLDKIVSDGGDLDFTVGGDMIAGGDMGSGVQEAFRENYPEVDGFLPQHPDMDVAHAKKLVQMLRDVGYGGNETVETRLMTYAENMQEEVVPYLDNAANALVRTLQHLRFCEDWDASDETGDSSCTYEDEDGYQSTITLSTVGDVNEDEETYTSINAIEIVGPNAAHYFAKFETTYNEIGNQISGEIEARFIDDMLGEPVEVSGMLTAVVEYNEATIDLNGEITSPVVDVLGSVHIEYRERYVEYDGFEYSVLDKALIDIMGDITFPYFNIGGGVVVVIEAFPDDEFGFFILPTEIRIGGSFYDFEEDAITSVDYLEFRLKDIDDIVNGTLRFPGFEVKYESRMDLPGSPSDELNIDLVSSQDFPAANWGFPQRNWYGGLESHVEYYRDDLTLEGIVRIAVGEETNWIELDLTSGDLDIYLTYGDGENAQGYIKLGDKVLAEIEVSGGVVMIEYRDGTFETLF